MHLYTAERITFNLDLGPGAGDEIGNFPAMPFFDQKAFLTSGCPKIHSERHIYGLRVIRASAPGSKITSQAACLLAAALPAQLSLRDIRSASSSNSIYLN